MDKMYSILTLVVLAVLLIVDIVSIVQTYKKSGKEAALNELRERAYKLFLRAEEKYGPKTGTQKMAWAVTQFYKLITKDKFENLLPNETVESFLQKTFDEGYVKLKDYLDDAKINGSVTQ